MDPEQRLAEPAEVERLPLEERADAFLAVHARLLDRLGLGPA